MPAGALAASSTNDEALGVAAVASGGSAAIPKAVSSRWWKIRRDNDNGGVLSAQGRGCGCKCMLHHS